MTELEERDAAIKLALSLRHRINQLGAEMETVNKRLSVLDGRRKRAAAATKGAAPAQAGGRKERRRGT